MSVILESLEGRTLFSVASVTADYQAVVADAATLKSSVTAAAAGYKSSSKAIAADIKALPKNKDNSIEIAKVNKAITAASTQSKADVAKIISVGKSALNKARSAFLANITHPSAAHNAKMTQTLAVLAGALGPYESKLQSDAAGGAASIAAELAALQSLNPTATALANDITGLKTAINNNISVFTSVLSKTNADITTLIAAIT